MKHSVLRAVLLPIIGAVTLAMVPVIIGLLAIPSLVFNHAHSTLSQELPVAALAVVGAWSIVLVLFLAWRWAIKERTGYLAKGLYVTVFPFGGLIGGLILCWFGYIASDAYPIGSWLILGIGVLSLVVSWKFCGASTTRN